ncbi:MAG: type I-E CRISPR-associated protein Cas5/CasD [Halorhodospira sp.]
MATLLMRLSGPMQSWGTTSRFDERETDRFPSKSGVLGIVCAALGRDRAEPVDDLAALSMGVRADASGVLTRDYQTATGHYLASGTRKANCTVESYRYYLADACFLVGLAGDGSLLAMVQQALMAPHWPLALGRKSFPPGEPIALPDGLREAEALVEALQTYPLLKGEAGPRWFALEDPEHGVVRMDQPLAPFAERRFGPRYVRQEEHDVSVPVAD